MGEDYPNGFAHGHTMRNNKSVSRFQFEEQKVVEERDSHTIITILKRWLPEDDCNRQFSSDDSLYGIRDFSVSVIVFQILNRRIPRSTRL
jgi:hypothetical protein